MQKCPNCSAFALSTDDATGCVTCTSCGAVVEESAIVSSVEFQDAGDRSTVIGQYVSETASKPYTATGVGRGGRTRYGSSRESREATLANARRVISTCAEQLRLPPWVTERAHRLYQKALEQNFVYGRRQQHVVATCLYVVCRQNKIANLLIDFSDALQTNVYVLGKCFLQFLRVFHLNLDPVDPSLYIHRFAERMNLGDKKRSVEQMAMRIVSRMKDDWILGGRRPDGVCVAALLIASRLHGFEYGQTEVAKLFRIGVDTLKHRLEEFKRTPAAQMTVQQFAQANIGVEYDPPSFSTDNPDAPRRKPGFRAHEKEKLALAFGDNLASWQQQLEMERQFMYNDILEELRATEVVLQNRAAAQAAAASAASSGSSSSSSSSAASASSSSSSSSSSASVAAASTDAAADDPTSTTTTTSTSTTADNETGSIAAAAATATGATDGDGSDAESEISNFSDVNDQETASFLVSAEEARKREALWNELNRDYLDSKARREQERDHAEDQVAEQARTDAQRALLRQQRAAARQGQHEDAERRQRQFNVLAAAEPLHESTAATAGDEEIGAGGDVGEAVAAATTVALAQGQVREIELCPPRPVAPAASDSYQPPEVPKRKKYEHTREKRTAREAFNHAMTSYKTGNSTKVDYTTLQQAGVFDVNGNFRKFDDGTNEPLDVVSSDDDSDDSDNGTSIIRPALSRMSSVPASGVRVRRPRQSQGASKSASSSTAAAAAAAAAAAGAGDVREEGKDAATEQEAAASGTKKRGRPPKLTNSQATDAGTAAKPKRKRRKQAKRDPRDGVELGELENVAGYDVLEDADDGDG